MHKAVPASKESSQSEEAAGGIAETVINEGPISLTSTKHKELTELNFTNNISPDLK